MNSSSYFPPANYISCGSCNSTDRIIMSLSHDILDYPNESGMVVPYATGYVAVHVSCACGNWIEFHFRGEERVRILTPQSNPYRQSQYSGEFDFILDFKSFPGIYRQAAEWYAETVGLRPYKYAGA